MAEQKVISLYKELPPWARGVIAVGGLAVVYFTARAIINKIKENQSLKDAKKTQQEFQDDLSDLKKRGVNPTFPASQYQGWADQIEKQFSGCDFQQNVFDMSDPLFFWAGTYSGSGKNLVSILKNFKNDADFASLVTAYKVRTYDQCGTWPFAGDFTGNLFAAISDELDQGEKDGINSMLAKQGITYRV
jgi:hypothetical protein